jgi:pescadillo
MEFMIISCGGKVGWEGSGSSFTINDATITHHVVDRPPTTTQQGMCFY